MDAVRRQIQLDQTVLAAEIVGGDLRQIVARQVCVLESVRVSINWIDGSGGGN